MTATETEKVRGVVIGIFNKASDTCVELANVSLFVFISESFT